MMEELDSLRGGPSYTVSSAWITQMQQGVCVCVCAHLHVKYTAVVVIKKKLSVWLYGRSICKEGYWKVLEGGSDLL